MRSSSLVALACTMALAGPVTADEAPHAHAHGDEAAGDMAHSDHSPKHGGVFFMAADKFHHVEGTYPEAGLLRVHVYDDHTKPIDPVSFKGTVKLESKPDDPGVKLEYEAVTRTLAARLVPAPAMPVDLELWLVLPGMPAGSEGALFNFSFAELTKAGTAAPAGSAHAHATGQSHAHGSPHGGQVVSAGKEHHLELVGGGPMLMLYVLDVAEKTLSIEGMTASIMVQTKGGSPKLIPLEGHGDHFMAASPLKSGQSAVAVASVKISGLTRTARFTLGKPAATPTTGGHRH